MSPVQRCAIASVRLYQQVLSPFLGPACRYQPSCSQYAIEAIELHGMLHGCRLALGRLLRCAPWGKSGWDPVPHTGLRIRGPHGS